MKHRHSIIAAALAATLAASTPGSVALAADIAAKPPVNFTYNASAAKAAGLKWQAADRTAEEYLALPSTATALQKKTALDSATAALRAFEAQVPGAKTDIAAGYAALKKAGLTDELDRAVYASPAAFATNSGELAAIKAAGGPSAVLANASKYLDQDVAEYRSRLGLAKTAWRFNLSPIPKAEARFFCSLGAWTMKTATCWWDDACYNYWASANNSNCQK